MKLLIPTIALALSLSACSSTITDDAARRLELRVTQDVCDLFTHQTYDGALDTPLTKEQIKRFNNKRAAFCSPQT